MAQFAESAPMSPQDRQPRKIVLNPPGFVAPPGLMAPPGLAAPPGLVAPPGCHTRDLTTDGWQAPPGLGAPVDIFVNSFWSDNWKHQLATPVSEYQRFHWTYPWALADQEAWDTLYEVCTETALDRCRAKSAESEETASTVDTLQDAEHETMIDEVIIDSLSHALKVGCEEQQNALKCITEQMQTMCTSQQGSLLVQSALAVATDEQLNELSAKLGSFLIDACKSPHGNHVVQKCIDALGHEKVHFIVDALQSKAVAMARDRFGCRIMQHLVDVCPWEQVSALIDEMMKDAARLCRHPFANYVMQSVVKSGTAARRAEMAEVLLLDAPGFSRHRFAKHVFQLAVLHGEPLDQTRLAVASKRPVDFFKI